eukprot:TCONS_00044673-protein
MSEENKANKNKQIKPFKFKGLAPQEHEIYKPIIESEQDGDHVIPPHYVKVSGANGVYHVAQYAATVRGVATKYDPEHNCDGNFMSAKFQPDNNCYAYSTNIASNSFAQPGRAHGIRFDHPTRENVKKGAIADGLIYVGGKELSPNVLWQHVPDYAPHKGHFVALLISKPKLFTLPDGENGGWPGDYHWIRCDNYGTNSWSQKDGGDQVTDFDFAGAPISDPRSACWTVNQGKMFQYDDQGKTKIWPDDVVVEYDFFCWMYVPNGKVHIL